MSIPFDLVVAMDSQRGIGKDGKLPWQLPGDMKHFKVLTSWTEDPNKKNAVIMGRKTWESIPQKFRPLPDRVNFILSRNEDYGVWPYAFVLPSLDAALAYCKALAYIERVFVIGGSQVYQEALWLPECRKVYLTQVHAEIPCDVRFPLLSGFKKTQESEQLQGEAFAYSFQVWEKSAV
jgi:dihydrofolate reductase